LLDSGKLLNPFVLLPKSLDQYVDKGFTLHELIVYTDHPFLFFHCRVPTKYGDSTGGPSRHSITLIDLCRMGEGMLTDSKSIFISEVFMLLDKHPG